MALTQRLEFRQSQALVMTPQLMQAIKLLQLSNLDLVAYVDAELERNPLLDRVEPDAAERRGEAGGEEGGEGNDRAGDSEPGAAGDWLEADMAPSRSAIEERLGTALDNVFPD